MGLEVPLALLGLLGVVIPLVVHRMRRRELPRVVLPTFVLLSKALARTQSKRAFTDLLLLLLRIGVIASAAFALATPYVRSQLRFGDGRLANLAIVIDDSLSMSRNDAGRSLIDAARARAIEVIQTLPEGSEVAVVLAGKPARVLAPLSRDLRTALDSLERAPLPAVRVDELSAGIELALREQTRGLVTPRRVLVLSDFARHAELDTKTLALDGAAIGFERIGAAPTKPNVFIAQSHASADPTRPNETSIAVELRATFGGTPERPIETRVEVEVNGRVASGASVTLEQGSAKTVLHVPTSLGDDATHALIRVKADDALEADNQAALVLGHADALQLLLVNGDPQPASRGDELYYVTRALSLLPEGELALHTQLVDVLSLEHVDLSQSDVVVLANVPAPSPVLAPRIIDFVRAGGGLIVAAGSRVEAAPYNARLGTVLPSHIRGNARCDNLHFTLGARGTALPEGLAGLREARSQERLLLEADPQVDTLLSYEDGLPAVVARSEGEGRSVLLATTLDADYSDLPLRPGFLPLLATLIREAAGATAAARSHVVPGESVALPPPRRDRFVEVRGPDGATQRFAAADSASAAPRFAETDRLGVFEIRSGESSTNTAGKLKATFIVDPPRAESDLTPGPIPDVGAGAATLPKPITVHVPFTPWLWLTVFALVALEGALRIRQRWSHAQGQTQPA
ncbi:MAG: hypothetical protein RL701_894 [Pseudomonadota bacterium]|jgi:hypothetical protein